MPEIIKEIENVLYTLEQVQVRGKQNMDFLLGSMMTLEQCAAKLRKLAAEAQEAAAKAE